MRKILMAAAVFGLVLTACGGGSQTTAEPEASQVQHTVSDKLNIYNWSDYVDPQTLSDFEKDTRLNIRYDYYDSNEALEAKLLTGKSGYDLVVPSVANVGRQIKAGAYRKIDKSLIPNYANIDASLLAMMAEVDPGNEYAVPYFWGINTLAINTQQVKKALGTDKLPENEWDLVFNPAYTRKLKSCGISYFDSAIEQIPLALHYLGKDPNSENPEDIKAAVDMMKTVRPDIKRFTSSGYIDDMATGNLCVAIGYGGDLNIAKTRARESANGVDIKVLVPTTGVGVWVDSLMIPRDAQNVANAHKYINHTLDPKVAAQNGSFVTYAPASLPARELMDAKYTSDASIFPTKELMQKSFIVSPKSSDVSRLSVRLWQSLKAGK
ncbi:MULTISPECIES: polyamine ABC transporter substrate-binding protein [Neisseria]|jgi:putrescine ABC transporter, periplasmic putrescine-binding protein|uniref:Putrescine-binding periplasmic protein n=1 Tax=Neisseria cinerea TaxID=483 RepID=A0A7T3BLB7_NEICI|nr:MULTISPECIES: polyamine ABC transporter substrate-binding protein [Neisseria]MBD0763868.1 polyamine ABC transporter substrate-binding protein [Neisseria sp. RH3002v2f]QPT37702.1 polyamine ABC transporter substrate-binding protein [Neisseria cinerea]SQF82849.1 Spermidine/putrescine ABC transporter, periplasmic spermidine/putrescine-binding protein [Neisseria cinerea]